MISHGFSVAPERSGEITVQEIIPNSPQENWTKFPNNILDNLDKFEANELKILCLMIRKNLGYQNPHKKFSLRYISALTGISKQTVITALIGLQNKKSIQKIDDGTQSGKWEVLWNKPITGQKIRPELVKKLDHQPVKKLDQVKENTIIIKQSERKEEKKETHPPTDIESNSYLESKKERTTRNENIEKIREVIKTAYQDAGGGAYNAIKDDPFIGQIEAIIHDDVSQLKEKISILNEMKKTHSKEFWKKSLPTGYYLYTLWNELISQKKQDNRGGYVPKNNI